MTYYLKTPEAKSDTLIMASYFFSGRRMVFSTGEHIHPKHWNAAKRRARVAAPNSVTLNRFLDELDLRVKRVHIELKTQFIQVTPDILRQAVVRDIRTDGGKETFMQFFARFIEESRPVRKKGSMSVYDSTYKILKGLPGAKDFADINPKWFEKLQTHMEGVRIKHIERNGHPKTVTLPNGYSMNYIGKTVAIIREVMTIAYKQGLHRNEAYRDTDYRKPHEEVDSIYLTVDELIAMYNTELPPGHGRVRDRFLIAGFTGLRFSDSSKITLDSVRDGLLFDRNQKTGTDVVIPIHWVVSEILRKYPDGLPPAITNQKFNEMIKEVGLRAGITTLVEKHATKGGVMITTTVPKYQLITSHTGRRSAITNMVLAGIPHTQVMKISGHKTTASFLKYVRMDAEQNARSIQSHPYFERPDGSQAG